MRLAFGTAAPEGSVAKPVRLPLNVCVNAPVVRNAIPIVRTNASTVRCEINLSLLCFLLRPRRSHRGLIFCSNHSCILRAARNDCSQSSKDVRSVFRTYAELNTCYRQGFALNHGVSFRGSIEPPKQSGHGHRFLVRVDAVYHFCILVLNPNTGSPLVRRPNFSAALPHCSRLALLGQSLQKSIRWEGERGRE